jgi:hypothetical protein
VFVSDMFDSPSEAAIGKFYGLLEPLCYEN